MKQTTKSPMQYNIPASPSTFTHKGHFPEKTTARLRAATYNFNQPPKPSMTTVKSGNKPTDEKHMKMIRSNAQKPSMDPPKSSFNKMERPAMKMQKHFSPENFEERKVLQNEIQRLKIENTMLNNEMNELNSELLQMNHRMQTARTEKQCLENYIKQLEAKQLELMNSGHGFQEVLKQKLEIEVQMMQTAKKELEDRICSLEKEKADEVVSYMALEAEKRNLQINAASLQNALQASEEKNQQLEIEFEDYKLNMKEELLAKDNEIKVLKERGNLTEDTKILIEQIDLLKKERDELKEETLHLQKICIDMKSRMENLEVRSVAAEHLYSNIKKSLKEERTDKQRIKAECNTLRKEIESLQEQTAATIARLQEKVTNKEMMAYKNLRAISSQSLIDSVVTGALNVADYASNNCSSTVSVSPNQTDMDDRKIKNLSSMINEKQMRIDELLCENGELKDMIQQLQNFKRKLVPIEQKELNAVEVLSKPPSTTASIKTNVVTVNNGSSLRRLLVRNKYIVIVITMSLHVWFIAWLLKRTPLELTASNVSGDSFSTDPTTVLPTTVDPPSVESIHENRQIFQSISLTRRIEEIID